MASAWATEHPSEDLLTLLLYRVGRPVHQQLAQGSESTRRATFRLTRPAEQAGLDELAPPA